MFQNVPDNCSNFLNTGDSENWRDFMFQMIAKIFSIDCDSENWKDFVLQMIAKIFSIGSGRAGSSAMQSTAEATLDIIGGETVGLVFLKVKNAHVGFVGIWNAFIGNKSSKN